MPSVASLNNISQEGTYTDIHSTFFQMLPPARGKVLTFFVFVISPSYIFAGKKGQHWKQSLTCQLAQAARNLAIQSRMTSKLCSPCLHFLSASDHKFSQPHLAYMHFPNDEVLQRFSTCFKTNISFYYAVCNCNHSTLNKLTGSTELENSTTLN